MHKLCSVMSCPQVLAAVMLPSQLSTLCLYSAICHGQGKIVLNEVTTSWYWLIDDDWVATSRLFCLLLCSSGQTTEVVHSCYMLHHFAKTVQACL